MAREIYVTGHRTPDLDSVASAIGYAELEGRRRPDERFVAVRLGPVNRQTAWALERSGATEPPFLPHVRLRVCDVMRPCVVLAGHDQPIRDVGLTMAERGLDMVPVVDAEGVLVGMVTEDDLARLYVRESQQASDFGDRRVRVGAIAGVLGAELLAGEEELDVGGRLWVLSGAVERMGDVVGPGDVAVVGDRPAAQRRAVELGVALLVVSDGARPAGDVLELARRRGAGVLASPLDAYVTARMIQLSVPVQRVMSREPLTVGPEDVLADVTPRILDVDYRAAVAVDDRRVPLAVVTRTDLVNPEPRRAVLVDHAEPAQSVPGVEEAALVEILDHHHVAPVATRLPVRATFDPVGSTATLVVERYAADGEPPTRPTAMLLLAAVLSDTVILSSPTTTDRDHRVVAQLEEQLGVDARALGREMFRAAADLSHVPADEIVRGDAKEYHLEGGRTALVAQVETVGDDLLERRDELRETLARLCRDGGHVTCALMVTDVERRGTTLLVAGDPARVARAFGASARDGAIDLPGVMSRKKQLVPRLLAAL